MIKSKLLYKVLGIGLLVIGLTFIVIGLIDLIQVANINAGRLPSEEIEKTNVLWPLLATPSMFSGFFFFILGFGKKKEYGK